MFRMFKKTEQPAMNGISIALNSAGSESHCTFPAPVIDSFRQMTTQLVYNNQLPSQIAVTSALHGEGVTYTGLALAATLANDLTRNICFVELNWWSPGLLKIFTSGDTTLPARRQRQKANGASAPQAVPADPQVPSLADVIAGRAPLADAVLETSSSNLKVVHAGNVPVEQRPVVARSSLLREIIQDLSGQFDHLICDVPAVLSTSDAVALASLCSSCCLVVRQGVTPKQSVGQALDDLKHLPMLGIVLNQVNLSTPRWIHRFIPQE
jgi:Mrp family chromosome partitioning ATPase